VGRKKNLKVEFAREADGKKRGKKLDGITFRNRGAMGSQAKFGTSAEKRGVLSEKKDDVKPLRRS